MKNVIKSLVTRQSSNLLKKTLEMPGGKKLFTNEKHRFRRCFGTYLANSAYGLVGYVSGDIPRSFAE